MNTFLDTNLLVYANDVKDARKHRIAMDRIDEAIRRNEAVVSTQVMAEFTDVAFRKLMLSPQAVLEQIALMESIDVVQVTPALIRRGIELREMYKVRFWDGCILAAAEDAGCGVILSEDLNPGQLYAGVKVENPFA